MQTTQQIDTKIVYTQWYNAVDLALVLVTVATIMPPKYVEEMHERENKITKTKNQK